MINQFKDDYRFLSNFYPSVIEYDSILYPTVEHFFQAMKSRDDKDRRFIAGLQYPGQAKKAGRKVVLRQHWGNLRIGVMSWGLHYKFTKHDDLKQMLISTFPHELVEGNYWNDKFWGVCLKTNEGENWLGNLLMKLRQELM